MSVIERAWSGLIKANQVKKLSISATGSIEVVRLDATRAIITVRLDGRDPVAFAATEEGIHNNFPVVVSRNFPVNNRVIDVRIMTTEDCLVSVEGTPY